MRKILALAFVGGAVALGAGASPASAQCYGAVAGNSNAYVCNERVWEKQRWYLTCQIDTPNDKFDAMCAKTVLIEYYG
jgi:hypothetical protein